MSLQFLTGSSNKPLQASTGSSSSGGKAESKKAPKKDLATKMDLEKFYVSLTRKLYNEGL